MHQSKLNGQLDQDSAWLEHYTMIGQIIGVLLSQDPKFCKQAVACFITIPSQCCCCMLIVISLVLGSFRNFDKLWVFTNVAIISFHTFILIQHILQTMMENIKIWPVTTGERPLNPHQPSSLDTKSEFIAKA